MFKILLIDDHVLFAKGLEKIINESENNIVVEVFDQPKLVLHYLNNNKVDLIITDLNMPEMNGIELITQIRQNLPNLKILIMTMYINSQLINELKKINVNGYLHKSIDSEELITAIEAVKANETYFSKSIRNSLDLNEFTFNTGNVIKDSFSRKFLFSKRELEVFLLIIQNKSSQEIADELFISKDTVSSHRKNIIKKTKCQTPIEMYQLAVEMGHIQHN